jgi:peptidoglycan/xylan/chitin deacetylase (PgdA/CDA1 family)
VAAAVRGNNSLVEPATSDASRAPAPMTGVGRSLPGPVKAAVTRARSAAWLLRGGAGLEPGLRILMYHRIADDPDPLAVPPRRFREQMAHLARCGYRVVDVAGALELLDTAALPPRAIGLTFDDGFLDVAEHALPVLRAHGFRATVFVTTGVADGRVGFPWYRRRQPPVLGWDEIAALDREGTLNFEAHTVTHPSLLAVDERRAWREIAGSREELQDRLGREITAFAYPAGLFGRRERDLAERAGYRAALSCEPGVNLPSTDRLALRRRQIDARDRLVDFRAKVGGGHDTPLPLRATYRRLRYGMGAGSPRATSSRA